MNSVFITYFLTTISFLSFGQKIELDSAQKELIGAYLHSATYDENWCLVSNSDTMIHHNFLFFTNPELSISKISKSDYKYLRENHENVLSDSNLYCGLKIFIGVKGGYQFLYSNETGKIVIDPYDFEHKQEVLIKLDRSFYYSFIYLGLEINGNLYWFKYIKTN